ncbi:flagellar biosynthetic protein FliR [Diaminobutyricimonas aerilata]|uniref:Flagellar biosynthetic protein FliR n=1 Tax=Diaminobutyricimonas aerilata TaxID=1162967 RepID=A0A2M9CMZ5_9MICO|nr:flagellar biosynthetic protein FliR [Diaminobutyricimonas aerilata]PJJ73273.1 flagellar biosynthetic protein FliR [Diaminobutyricimonas aerilata]
MEFAVDAAWLEAVALAGVRMIGFLVIAPPFAHNGFPLRIKGMLAVGLAVAVSPRVTPGYEALDTWPFLSALVLELLAGLALGFLVYVLFSAVQSAGNLIDLFGGFQLAQAFDPQSMVNGAQFTRLFHLTALALLFATDGYQLILGGLIRTFDAVPIGGGIDMAWAADAALGGITQMFVASVQIAGPLLVVLFLADVGLGLLTRVAPAMNALSLGFPLKILLTVVLAGILFLALPRVVAALAGEAVTLLTGVG